MRFSQRIGRTPVAKLAQLESVDDELRAGLWNAVTAWFWDGARNAYGDPITDASVVATSTIGSFLTRIWADFYKKPVDLVPKHWGDARKVIRQNFFQCEWFVVYDFIEFLAGTSKHNGGFENSCNTVLEGENSGYRFVKGHLTSITSQAELAAVDDAIEQAAPFPGVRHHLETALTLLSDRKAPDYRNSIKESISAVESLAKTITGKDKSSLGAALTALEQKGVLHGGLKAAFSSLYGYTSDAEGIRHALMDEPTLTKADARFMLVCCSSFVNLVIESGISAPA